MENLEKYEISPDKLKERIRENKRIRLIDVREEFEFNEGHIRNSMLLPVNRINPLTVKDLNLKKDDEIILICRSGGRSAAAQELFGMMGYDNAKSLYGGGLLWGEKGYRLLEA